MELLPQDYYLSEDVLFLARDLLGKVIVSSAGGQRTSAIIVETEAYKAPEDKASHAVGNKRTGRTEIMFQSGGVSYVYLCYGIHHLCNVVTGPEGVAHAVLIRAVAPIEGVEIMKQRRGIKGSQQALTNGPGKWTMAMGITTTYNGACYSDPNSLIQIFDAPSVPRNKVVTGPRVGVGYAGECALWPWRFRVLDNLWTSKPEVATYPGLE